VTLDDFLDPTCLFHGKKASEHVCLYCCICFQTLTPDECWVDGDGVKWDLCVECGEREQPNPGGEVPVDAR